VRINVTHLIAHSGVFKDMIESCTDTNRREIELSVDDDVHVWMVICEYVACLERNDDDTNVLTRTLGENYDDVMVDVCNASNRYHIDAVMEWSQEYIANRMIDMSVDQNREYLGITDDMSQKDHEDVRLQEKWLTQRYINKW
jgi:hypothetical protein